MNENDDEKMQQMRSENTMVILRKHLHRCFLKGGEG